jgi:hypothetical protein
MESTAMFNLNISLAFEDDGTLLPFALGTIMVVSHRTILLMICFQQTNRVTAAAHVRSPE